MNPLNLIPAAYRLWVTLGLVVAIAGFSYATGRGEGRKLATADCDREKLVAVQRAIEQAQEIAKQDAEIVGNNVQTVQAIRDRTRNARNKEKRYATAKPLPVECVLDDDRLRNINAALANKAAADPGQPDGTMPPAAKLGR